MKAIKLLLVAVTLMTLAACGGEEQKCIDDGGVWFGDSDNGYCCPPNKKDCKDPQPTRRDNT
ncbi:hypothetical protein LPP1_g19 [Leptolyngbya phage LPP-1]|uniref:Lipoprotein n=1 Tax=Leptolyngbya phage LPP-1 TaxID=2996049 RepID=A0AAE9PZ37_9CAUD|nr:hypothetical protein LPP1_g19 [Leptolyngbya phage LPP-1]